MLYSQKIKKKLKTFKTAFVKRLMNLMSNQYAISKVFRPPKKTAKWTPTRNKTTWLTKLCGAARKQTVFRQSNLYLVKKTLYKEKSTPSFTSICKSARQSKGKDLNGLCQMVSCCMQTTFIFGCVKLNLLGSLAQTATTCCSKPKSTKPCVRFWLTG